MDSRSISMVFKLATVMTLVFTVSALPADTILPEDFVEVRAMQHFNNESNTKTAPSPTHGTDNHPNAARNDEFVDDSAQPPPRAYATHAQNDKIKPNSAAAIAVQATLVQKQPICSKQATKAYGVWYATYACSSPCSNEVLKDGWRACTDKEQSNAPKHLVEISNAPISQRTKKQLCTYTKCFNRNFQDCRDSTSLHTSMVCFSSVTDQTEAKNQRQRGLDAIQSSAKILLTNLKTELDTLKESKEQALAAATENFAKANKQKVQGTMHQQNAVRFDMESQHATRNFERSAGLRRLANEEQATAETIDGKLQSMELLIGHLSSQDLLGNIDET